MKYLLPLAVIFSIFINPAFGLSQPDPNYVVIGAFSISKNAVKWSNQAKSDHLSAKYELNKIKNLYYVYVMITDDHEAALSEAMRLRKTTRYQDAWVYQGTLGDQQSLNASRDVNPVTKLEMIDVKNKDQSTPTSESVVIVEEENNNTAVAPLVEEPVKEKRVVISDDGVVGKNFVFKVYRGNDLKEVPADIQVLDIEKGKKLATYQGNAIVKVKAPNPKTPQISLMCDVFGYRKMQRNVDYNNPVAEDISLDEDGNVVVPFELIRLQKGDIAVMYNVLFFNDAAIMRPESRYEINSLLAMMIENPNYRIKLHGHTNGGGQGKIIRMGETDNFFSLTGSVSGFGSSKALSEARAKVIADYLAANGIDPGRIEIKAWGGKRAIYDKNHARAAENVRVEVEILND